MKATSQNTFWRRLAGPALVAASMLVSSTVAATTIGSAYWQWWTIVDGGQGVGQGPEYGAVWDTPATAPFSQTGNQVSLAVNTSLCQDNLNSGDAGGITYWCDDKKWVRMQTYENVSVPAGDPSVATFSGCFGNSTMTGNTVKAFLKILAPNYSQTYAEVFSGDAECWDHSFELDGSAVNVQKGFEVLGPNANPNDGDPGAVVAYIGATQNPDDISSALEDPTGIPVLPLWALFGLAGLIGLMGLRRKA